MCESGTGEASISRKLSEIQTGKDFTSSDVGIKIKLFRENAEYIYFCRKHGMVQKKHERGEQIMINAAFIYVAPGQNPQEQKAVIPSETLTLHVVGCSTYDEAEAAAKELVANGCGAIELCAGFGNEGIARIKKAVGPEIPVGAVKFDYHPAFGFKSGDELFQ